MPPWLTLSYLLCWYKEFLLTFNCLSEDKEAWPKSPSFFRSLNVMTWLTSHLTLKPMPSASAIVERSSSKEKVRWSSLPLDYNWDTINPMLSNIKLLGGSVHLSVSLPILGYFERSLKHTTFKGGESNEISGLGSALVLSLSWSLEVTSVKSSFFWELLVYTWFESPLSASDSVSSKTTSCTEASSAKRVVFTLVWVWGTTSLTNQRSKKRKEKVKSHTPYLKEEHYKDNKVKEEGTYSWFLHSRSMVLPFSFDG